MTVIASPADVGPGTQNGTNNGQLGKGQLLLNGIAATQTAYNNAVANSINKLRLGDQLTLLQIEAVDYFMGSYWVSADQIIAQMYPAKCVIPKAGDKFITAQVAAIAARIAEVNALVAANYTQVGTPPGGLALGGPASQYSVGYPAPNSGYPLTTPDVLWYQLNTQLVDYMMTKAVLPASLILSFMTGMQTYPWNGYTSNYTWYQPYWDDY